MRKERLEAGCWPAQAADPTTGRLSTAGGRRELAGPQGLEHILCGAGILFLIFLKSPKVGFASITAPFTVASDAARFPVS